jgi:hypothetical protein
MSCHGSVFDLLLMAVYFGFSLLCRKIRSAPDTYLPFWGRAKNGTISIIPIPTHPTHWLVIGNNSALLSLASHRPLVPWLDTKRDSNNNSLVGLGQLKQFSTMYVFLL